MTQPSTTSPDSASSLACTKPPLWLHTVVGGLQGFALWGLVEASRQHWIDENRTLFVALLYALAVAPLAWQFSHDGFARVRTRIVFALAMGLLFAGFGMHLAASLALPDGGAPPFGFPFVGALLAFVLVALACGVDPARRRFAYERLFEIAWRNAILGAVAVALTILLWILLFAASWLMDSIGLHGMRRLLDERAFYMPVTGAALGLSIGLALARAEMLSTLRRFWFAVTSWFLPLALAFAVVWVAALPFTGVEPLFATRHAALYLLWFCALAVKFLNTGYRSGVEAPAYPPWLATALQWLWLAIPVLLGLAGWALWLRTAQHGWTPDRIWAAVVWLLLMTYALGYTTSIFRKGPWMHTVPATNIVAAILAVVLGAALVSPLADVRRLAVADQLNRLEQGKIGPAEFDWRFLGLHSGPYGIEALKELAARTDGDASSREIAGYAATELSHPQGNGRRPAPATVSDRLAAVRKIVVKPVGAAMDEALAAWLARPKGNDFAFENHCLVEPDKCAVWLVDLDDDGQREMVVLSEVDGNAEAALYANVSGEWRKQGMLRGGRHTLSEWLAAIDGGTARAVPPRWPDVMLGDERMEMRPW